MTILSERGLLANVTLGDGSLVAQLQAASVPQEGVPVDLEFMNLPDGQGGLQKKLIAAYGEGGPQQKTLRVLDLVDLEVTHNWDVSPVACVYGKTVDIVAVQHEVDESEPGDHLVGLFGGQVRLFDQNGVQLAAKELCSFAPAVHACAIAVGELDAGNNGDPYTQELVIATEPGRLVWMHVGDLLLGSGTNFVPPLTVNDRLAIGDAHCNDALAATWPMWTQPAGGGNVLQALDQTGTRWQVATTGAAPGQGTLVHELREPILGLMARAVRSARRMASPAASANAPVVIPSAMIPGNQPARALWVSAWCPDKGAIAVGMGHDRFNGSLLVFDDLWVFPEGGDVLGTASDFNAYWWSGRPANIPNDWAAFADLIEGMHAAGSPLQVQTTWASTAGQNGGPGTVLDLRNNVYQFHGPDTQSLRLIDTPGGPRIVVGTYGGSVLVIDPAAGPGQVPKESRDFGTGGCALAVVPAAGGGHDIFYGTVHANLERGNYGAQNMTLDHTGRMTGSLHWLHYGNGTLTERAELVLRTSATDPRGGFGVCGIAVGDVMGLTENEEIVVTTFTGDLFVFARPPGNDNAFGPPLYRTWLPGSLGAYNGMLIADLDGVAGNELYVAGSMGLRRFVRQ